ncbi:protein of unknown function [Streptococcus thermophilus]|nr:protein of unknown function [Streptococcus thermophilus]CAD0145719.1 protein of unknown function [Streptococcus thermophilus]CAD0147263.1 protein of unknown function [Streptococcus thermophilus]
MKNTCVYDELERLDQELSSDVRPSYGSLRNHDSLIHIFEFYLHNSIS